MYLPYTSNEQVLATLQQAGGSEVLWLLCVAEGHAPALPDLLAGVRQAGMRVCGGVFPGLIDGEICAREGIVAIPLPPDSRLCLAGLAPTGVNWLQPLPELQVTDCASCLVLLDSRAPNISGFLEEIFDCYGNFFRYAGAGAGFHDLRPEPGLFTEQGFFPHGGLVVIVPRPLTVQVRHGWERVQGPFIATRTQGNVIQELNWAPAGQFYRDVVLQVAPTLAGRPVFPDMMASFPLGIGKEGDEDVLRDPLGATDDQALLLLSDVPENAVMYLCHGNQASLVAAARSAAEACAGAEPARFCFIADCYSRALMLAEHFPQELAAVQASLSQQGNIRAEGVLAMGEIADSGQLNLEFFNKTIVLALGH